jgi:hypothetical protein
MSGCKRVIFLIFGALLFTAIIVVPYNSTHVRFKTDPYSRDQLRVTTKKKGYLFLPHYLNLKSRKPHPLKVISYWSRDKDAGWDSYEFNTSLFILEMVIIILAGGFDYIIFCVVLPKSKRTRF